LIQQWQHSASSEPDRIREWWQRWPEANVAILTGQGLLVIDVDPRNGGDESLRALEDKFGSLGAPTVRTGSGGTHYYFHYDRAIAIRCNHNTKLGAGLDVKGERGYVVAPPSNHASGGRYGWLVDEHDFPEAPGWLIEQLRNRPKRIESTVAQGVVGTEQTELPDRPKLIHSTIAPGSLVYDDVSAAIIEYYQLDQNGSDQSRYRGRCPRHRGKSNTSFAISRGANGQLLMYCFGCQASFAELWRPSRETAYSPTAVRLIR
jgi:hypothetical protein